MASYDISSDSDLEDAVRGETLYEDTADELSASDLDQIISNAKMEVHARMGSDSWYADRGMGLILFGYTCAKAKAAVENMPVQEFNLDPVRIVARDSSGNEVQFGQYERMVKTGLKSTSVTTSNDPLLSVSNSWMTSDPTPGH